MSGKQFNNIVLREIGIIGGGLAGLVSAILLAKNSCKVYIVEKHSYPRHKVCGEYISMEIHDFLKKENLLPGIHYPIITNLLISDEKGRSFSQSLSSGGFGLSRYLFEDHLYKIALRYGVQFHFDEATDIKYKYRFQVKTKGGKTLNSDLLICSYGKRTKLDRQLNRNFFSRRSPYVGVKFHADYPEFPTDQIALHNFRGGYCGICNVENDITNFCYLVHRDIVKEGGGIEGTQEKILKKNPALKEALENSASLYDRPLVINEISFETKSPVEGKMMMIGDAAGMITPLCGNGMAMAMHTAKIVSEVITGNLNVPLDKLLGIYHNRWNETFAHRLWWGRFIQRGFFGKKWASSLAVGIGKNFGTLTQYLVSKTHGKPIL